MTPDIPTAAGPVCDICEQYVSMGSLMQYADYSQTRFCGNCAPDFLRSVAGVIEGGDQPVPCAVCDKLVPDEWVPDHAAFHALENMTSPQVTAVLGEDGRDSGDTVIVPGAEPGDAGDKPDHWAGTKTVRKSTHGHRTPRATATGKPREDGTK